MMFTIIVLSIGIVLMLIQFLRATARPYLLLLGLACLVFAPSVLLRQPYQGRSVSYSGRCLMNGRWPKTSHPSPLTTPAIRWTHPSGTIIERQPQDISSMPKLPSNDMAQVINAEAAPVAPACCSSSRCVLGGRIIPIAMVAGMVASASNSGDRCPSVQMAMPLAVMTAKP